MNDQNKTYKYYIDPASSSLEGRKLPIQADYIESKYSTYLNRMIFIVLNPNADLNIFLNRIVFMKFYINECNVSERVYIKKIEKIENGCIILYERKDLSTYEENIISFANSLYYFSNKKERVWKEFSIEDKKKYLNTIMSTVPWRRSKYPKRIIIDGNNINGCYDFYCELGFLLNNNQWGYFGWNLDALYDCLTDLPTDTQIIWKNYKRSRILMDEDGEKLQRLKTEYMFRDYADEICNILKERVQFERID